jgi:hypothetical protein
MSNILFPSEEPCQNISIVEEIILMNQSQWMNVYLQRVLLTKEEYERLMEEI